MIALHVAIESKVRAMDLRIFVCRFNMFLKAKRVLTSLGRNGIVMLKGNNLSKGDKK